MLHLDMNAVPGSDDGPLNNLQLRLRIAILARPAGASVVAVCFSR